MTLRTAFVLLAAATPVRAQEPATLGDYYAIARTSNPMLRAARAAVDAAAAREPAAGLLSDPMVQLGIMNASLPGLSTNMPGAMAPSIQVMQRVQLPGTLRLSAEVAQQTTAMARSGAEEAWWEVRTRVALAFYDVYRADRQLVVMGETLDWLAQLEQVAMTMYATGGGTQGDVLRAGVETARMKADVARMEAMRVVAAARLNALLDRPADAIVTRPQLVPFSAEVPDAEVLEAWAAGTRPLLAQARTALSRARTEESLAARAIRPDVTIGVQYGQRGGSGGVERMGSVMVGFSAPVFAGRRQLPMRDAAAAMAAMSAAELASAQAEVRARIGELRAELDRAHTLIVLYRTDVLPQAEANVTAALSSYRVGRADFMTVLDAQMTLNRYSIELHALVAEYGGLAAELEMTVGRELPATTRTIVEES